MVQDYVQRVVGSCKRVEASYGPDGRSRGIFTILLGSSQAATEAVKLFNNNTIDGKKMKVCVVFFCSGGWTTTDFNRPNSS